MKTRGKIILAVVIAGAVAVGALGALSQKSRGGPVDVFPVSNISYGGYGYGSSLSGSISGGKIQQITMDETPIETINVEEGAEVKKGDLLMKYETEEFRLKLESDKAKIAVLKANLVQYQNDITEYQKMRPSSYVPPTYKTVDHGPLNIRSIIDTGAGSDADPNYDMLFRVTTSSKVTAAFLKSLRSSGKTAEFMIYNGNTCYGSWIVNGSDIPNTTVSYNEITIEEYVGTEEVPVDKGSDENERVPKDQEDPDDGSGGDDSGEDDSGDDPGDDSGDPEEPETEIKVITRTRTVYERVEEEAITSDWIIGTGLSYSGGNLITDGSGAGYGTFQSMEPEEYERFEKVVVNEGGYTEGYTREELASMIAEARQNIKDTDMELRQAELDYEQDKLDGDTGEVRARFDGYVETVGDLESLGTGDVVLTVKGDEAYQVKVYINEYSLDTLVPGTTLNVTTYESGTMCQAVISDVSTTPANGYYAYSSNPNSSWYEATADITEPNGELIIGEYCEATAETGLDENALYLERAYVRNDDGGNYVMAVGEDGLLEKRYVKTGQIIWGSSIEIKEGLTAEDRIAVPYGKNVREGAPVTDKDYPEY